MAIMLLPAALLLWKREKKVFYLVFLWAAQMLWPLLASSGTEQLLPLFRIFTKHSRASIWAGLREVTREIFFLELAKAKAEKRAPCASRFVFLPPYLLLVKSWLLWSQCGPVHSQHRRHHGATREWCLWNSLVWRPCPRGHLLGAQCETNTY